MASVSLISMLPAPLTDASSVATAVFRSIPVTASAVSLFAVTRPIPPMASPVAVNATLPIPAFTLAARSNDVPVSVTLPLVALTAPFTVSAPVFVTVTLPAVEVNPVTDRPFWSNNTMLFCATPPALTRLLPVCPRVTPPLAALKLNPLPDSAPPVCVIFPVVAVNATLPIPAFTLAAKSMVEPFSTMFPPPLLTSSETVSPWLVVTSILPPWLSRPLTSNAPVLPSVMLPIDVPEALATASEPSVTASAEVNVSALPVSVPAVWAIAPAVVVKSTLPAPAFTSAPKPIVEPSSAIFPPALSTTPATVSAPPAVRSTLPPSVERLPFSSIASWALNSTLPLAATIVPLKKILLSAFNDKSWVAVHVTSAPLSHVMFPNSISNESVVMVRLPVFSRKLEISLEYSVFSVT